MSNVAGLSIAAANAALNALRDRIDNGAGPGTLEIYSGSRPANADTAPSGTLLGVLTFSDPCAAAAASKTLTFSAITEDSAANASGTATWARIKDSAGAAVFDCDVSATGGGGLIELNTTAIVVGGPIRVTSATLSFP